MVSGAEAGLRQGCDAAVVHTTISKVAEVKKTSRPPNLTQEEEEVLKEIIKKGHLHITGKQEKWYSCNKLV